MKEEEIRRKEEGGRGRKREKEEKGENGIEMRKK